jgi:lysozyme family protein
MSFEIALKYSLQFEGGYVNDPDDRGGETNKGITKAVYDDYRKKNSLPIQSVKNISDKEVHDIYYKQYWLAAGCDKLSDKLAIVTFDMAINSGVSRAKRYLTLTQDPNKYLDLRESFFKKIVQNRPSQKKFLKGWLNRVNNLRKIIA